MLIERVVGRRLDPVSGEIFHMKFKPPPKEVEGRLIQRSDDTEEKVGGNTRGAGVKGTLQPHEGSATTWSGCCSLLCDVSCSQSSNLLSGARQQCSHSVSVPVHLYLPW